MRALLTLFCIILSVLPVQAATCEQAAMELNRTLRLKIDAKELAEALASLNKSNNQSLSPKFITKREAQSRMRVAKNLETHI